MIGLVFCLLVFVLADKDDKCNTAGGCPRVKHFDVCVLGGGAGGVSTAVMLKDKGYDVVLMERRGRIGGHCKTVPAPGGPPVTHKTPNWLEIGVQVIPDTFYSNVKNGYNATTDWKIDTRSFVTRFCPVFSILESVFVNPHVSYAIDTEHGVFLGPLPPSPPNPDAPAAFGRLYAIYAQYPWLDNGMFDGPVPAELMVPWAQFLVTHNLSAIIDPLMYIYLWIGGLGSWNQLPAYFALRNLAPTITQQDFQSNFVMEGGCQTMYNNMVAYLGGNEKVWTNVTTTSFNRPSKNSNKKIEIEGTRNGEKFSVTCKKIVVGFPQTPSNLATSNLDLDEKETKQFATIKSRVYSASLVTVIGPINSTNNANFSAARIDVTNPFQHNSQGWIAVYNQVPYAPNVMYGFSNVPISSNDYRALLEIQLNLSKPFITNYTIHDVNTHGFWPAPSVEALLDPVGFYTKLHQLQGRRNTFWTGTVQSGFVAHHAIFDKAKRLVDEFF